MGLCARCSVDIGEGGVLQENGTRLCGACDLRLNAPAAAKPPAETLIPLFCPKCNAVWNAESTSCPKCNWDVVAQRHVEPKAKKKAFKIWVDPAGAAIMLVVLIGGYIAYDYYQASKIEKRKQGLLEAQAELDHKAAEAKAAEEREKARLFNEEQARIKTATAEAERARMDLERKQRDEAAAKKREADKLARDQERQRGEEERRAHLAAQLAMNRENRIARYTGDLHDALDILKKTGDSLEAVKRRYNDAKRAGDGPENQNKLAFAANELFIANTTILDAQNRLNIAKTSLRELGADPEAIITELTKDTGAGWLPGGAAAAPTAASSAPTKEYTLKDGRTIRAVNAVVSGDVVAVKDERGKFITINKADIESEKDLDAAQK